MTEQIATPPEIRIKDMDKLMMFAECPGVEGRRSKLSWAIRDGAPRVTVYTNDPSDTENRGVISAPMDPTTFMAFLDYFDEVIKSPNEIKYRLECWGKPWVNGEPSTERALKGEIWIGKDNQGMVWISVTAPERPKIRFEYLVSEWHFFTKPDGKKLTRAEGSVVTAAATVSLLRSVVPIMLANVFENPAPKPQRQNNNNYNNRNNQPRRNEQQPPPPRNAPPVYNDFDDIPL